MEWPNQATASLCGRCLHGEGSSRRGLQEGLLQTEYLPTLWSERGSWAPPRASVPSSSLTPPCGCWWSRERTRGREGSRWEWPTDGMWKELGPWGSPGRSSPAHGHLWRVRGCPPQGPAALGGHPDVRQGLAVMGEAQGRGVHSCGPQPRGQTSPATGPATPGCLRPRSPS